MIFGVEKMPAFLYTTLSYCSGIVNCLHFVR